MLAHYQHANMSMQLSTNKLKAPTRLGLLTSPTPYIMMIFLILLVFFKEI
jgi:hypothetical protein